MLCNIDGQYIRGGNWSNGKIADEDKLPKEEYDKRVNEIDGENNFLTSPNSPCKSNNLQGEFSFVDIRNITYL